MVREKGYIPDRGDIVWINFNPQKGREQAKKRPAIIISPKLYNKKSSLALACPITSQIKGYPFEVTIDQNKINGAILVDQIRSLDWKARKATFIIKAKPQILDEVIQKVLTLIIL